MTVLMKVTKEATAAAKAQATKLYMDRVEGHDIDWAAGQDEHGNYSRKLFRGAISSFTVQYIDPLLKLVTGKLSEGWKLSAVGTEQAVYVYTVYLVKPDADIAADLILEHAEAVAALTAKVEKDNAEIVERQIALRIESEARAKAAQLAKDELEQANRIRREVEDALGVTRKTASANA